MAPLVGKRAPRLDGFDRTVFGVGVPGSPLKSAVAPCRTITGP